MLIYLQNVYLRTLWCNIDVDIDFRDLINLAFRTIRSHCSALPDSVAHDSLVSTTVSVKAKVLSLQPSLVSTLAHDVYGKGSYDDKGGKAKWSSSGKNQWERPWPQTWSENYDSWYGPSKGDWHKGHGGANYDYGKSAGNGNYSKIGYGKQQPVTVENAMEVMGGAIDCTVKKRELERKLTQVRASSGASHKISIQRWLPARYEIRFLQV